MQFDRIWSGPLCSIWSTDYWSPTDIWPPHIWFPQIFGPHGHLAPIDIWSPGKFGPHGHLVPKDNWILFGHHTFGPRRHLAPTDIWPPLTFHFALVLAEKSCVQHNSWLDSTSSPINHFQHVSPSLYNPNYTKSHGV